MQNRRHITFLILPNHPHVGPTLPIASVLVRRGYRVTYVTSERFAPRVSDLGIEVFPYAVTFRDDMEVADKFIDSTNRALAATEKFYASNRPDMIVYDHSLIAGRVLANRLRIPAVHISPCFAIEQKHQSEQVPHLLHRKYQLDLSAQMDRVLAHFGICSPRGWRFHRETLNIYPFSKAIQPCIEHLEGRCFFAGRCPGEQPYYGQWTNTRRDGVPIVLVSTSTNYIQGADYFRMCIDALSNCPWHVILSIGDAGNSASLQPIPSNFAIVQGVSHVKILPHVCLHIGLGGIITSSEAAYHGVPLLVTSLGWPELEWQADNLVRAGLGVHLRKSDMSASSLRQMATRAFQDPTLCESVKRLRDVVRREPGSEEAANEIEAVLEDAT